MHAVRFADVRVVEHDGSNAPGWRARATAMPAKRAGIVILTNAPGGARLHREVYGWWVRWASGGPDVVAQIDQMARHTPIAGAIGVALGTMLIVFRVGRRWLPPS